MEEIGQKAEAWTEGWKRHSIENEIRMWDFFGLRPWILKFTPRFGKVMEAGCGLGRNNFYLSHLGIEISGLDFSEETINYLRNWQKTFNYDLEFIVGNIKNINLSDNSLSGYLSFGVIEHFQEGPHEVLAEVYRVLRPGGIAIITTPNKSWNILRLKLINRIKKIVKRIIGREIVSPPFFQYEYSPGQLKRFITNSGLYVTVSIGSDFLYSISEYKNFSTKGINRMALRLSSFVDKSIVRNLGAQSIIIAVKLSDIMYCFLCGELRALKSSIETYTVPLCPHCISKSEELTRFYLKKTSTYFHNNYIINRKLIEQETRNCDFCGEEYITDYLFEDFGFSKNVCPVCLNKHEINILLSNKFIQAIWRERSRS